MDALYRTITANEIEILEKANCQCQDWARVSVKHGFKPVRMRDVTFAGECRLGVFDSVNSGVYRSTIKDSEIGDNAYVSDNYGVLDNYHIEAQATVCANGDMVFCSGADAGCGGSIDCVNEAGGRGVIIYPGISAQEAYLQAFSCHDATLAKMLKQMARRSAHTFTREYGVIASGAVVKGCADIKDSHFTGSCNIKGATRVCNSVISGKIEAGSSVVDSIVADGAEVGVNCLLRGCYIAAGAVVGEGYTAENTLVFANSELMRGEACSVFAGPYTVSHHQATLLLTALYSFYNAGSATNFSNHRYKLGPVHQGIFERGGKSGSSSYVLWPSHIGAFTSVIGKHTASFDISEFPCSLLIEQKGRSVLLPGANIYTAGMERDLVKWQKRDRRPECSPDIINTQGLNPLTANTMLKALDILTTLAKPSSDLEYKGAVIPGGYINKARSKYNSCLHYYYGEILVRAVESGYLDEGLPAQDTVYDCWYDWAGLLLPETEADKLLSDISEGKVNTSNQLRLRLQEIHDMFGRYEWYWLAGKLYRENSGTITKALLLDIIRNWLESLKLRRELIVRDAQKEYSDEMKIGYGLLGDVQRDFSAVRGTIDENSFVNAIIAQGSLAKDRAASASQYIETELKL